MKTDNSDPFVLLSDFIIFALGGKSWRKTGSDGNWEGNFQARGIKTIPFAPSNCGVKIGWPDKFIKKWEGHPIKNIVLSSSKIYVSGEALVTHYGLEGSAVYALSRIFRDQLKATGKGELYLDLKPSISDRKFKSFQNSLESRKPVTKILKEDLKLERIKIGLIKAFTDRETFTDRKQISSYIKNFKLEILGLSEMDKAISTVGGIALSEVDAHLQFKNLRNHFAIGEMLDWDALTGGYLLQACFSMGAWVAQYLNEKI